MTATAAVEARLLVEDPRWPSYMERLVKERDKTLKALLAPGLDHPRMSRLAGYAKALNFALGLPDELEKPEPTPTPGDDA